MPMGLLSTTQKWKTLSEHVCAVSINGNVTFHEQQECVYDFPSLSAAEARVAKDSTSKNK